MLLILAIEAFILAAAIFAWAYGGAPERAAAVLLPIAAFLSLLIAAFPQNGFASIELGYLSVDLALLLGLVALAMRANRWWPLWVAALHLLALAVHGVRGVDPTILPIIYTRLTGFMAIPICVVLIWGTWNYRRRTRLQGVAPRDWSRFR